MKLILKLFLVTSLVFYSQIYSQDVKSILTEKSGWWGPNFGASNWGWGFRFSKSWKLDYIYSGEGSHEISGNYKIDKEKIIISLDKKDSQYFKVPHGFICEIVSVPESLIFKKLLSCNDQKYYYGYGHLSNGDTKVIDGISVITLGRKRAIITSDVMYREKPSKQASTISCKQIQRELKASTALPRTSIVHVYARTLQKESIDKWTNYWYYVSPMYDPYSGESCKADFGWIFAEFIKWDSYQDN
ncbi:MAG: hypothetical protein SFU98_11335 [Leptospiraceae bacterium]|nr:hypothetical protein [Leptospiraceae bacterium]